MASNTSPDGIVYPDASDPIAPLNAVFQDLAESVQDALDNRFPATTTYQYVDTVYFTSSGDFEKADYPWLRAIRVRVQGAGGGGGGAATTGATTAAVGGSGGGGVFAESFITNISGLADSETVTVGSGGAGGAAGANAGSAGGTSSFGSLVSANGGGGGGGGGALGLEVPRGGGPGGSVGVGDLVIPGSSAGYTNNYRLDTLVLPISGDSFLSGSLSDVVFGSGDGVTGRNYGGGALGGFNILNSATARAGGAGGPGIVIVELYA
jgi:hypothetical protein